MCYRIAITDGGLQEVTEAIIRESLRLCSERCLTSRSQLDTCPPPIFSFSNMSANTSGGHEVCQALCRVSYSVRKFSFLFPSAVWKTYKAAVMICMFYAILYGGHNSVASLLVAFLSLCRMQNCKCKWACTNTLQAFGTLGSRFAEQVLKHYFVKINEMPEFITVNKEQLCSLLGESAFTADNQSRHNGAGSSGPRYELASSEGKAALLKPKTIKQEHQSWNA